jgi:N-acetylglucosamine transport system substrate-binding protein
MKKATKADFKMTGVPDFAVTDNAKLPKAALHATAGEGYVIPSAGANVAGGKELLRTMLSKEAATNFVKTRLAPTIVKGLVPADGFGSTALVSQVKMLDDAASNVFSWNFVDIYGINKDMLVPWNSFLAGDLDAPGLTKALQQITDNVLNDSSVTKVIVK